ATQAEADFVFPTRNDLHQPRQLDDVLNHVLTLGCVATAGTSHQDVEIANGFSSAPQRPGPRDLLNSRNLGQVFNDLVGLVFSDIKQVTAADAAKVFDRLE